MNDFICILERFIYRPHCVKKWDPGHNYNKSMTFKENGQHNKNLWGVSSEETHKQFGYQQYNKTRGINKLILARYLELTEIKIVIAD